MVLPDTAITKLRSLASEFVRLPIIQVSVCWSLHEREFVSVGFRGNESGQLGSSLAALKRMFSAILEDQEQLFASSFPLHWLSSHVLLDAIDAIDAIDGAAATG